MVLPDTRKVDTSHVPAKEKKRRETWRPKLNLTDELNEVPKEQNEEEYSPSLGGHSPASPNRTLLPPELFMSTSGTSPVCLYVPSLKSLPEEAGLMSSEGEDDDSEKEGLTMMERSKSESHLRPETLPKVQISVSFDFVVADKKSNCLSL